MNMRKRVGDDGAMTSTAPLQMQLQEQWSPGTSTSMWQRNGRKEKLKFKDENVCERISFFGSQTFTKATTNVLPQPLQ
ncbi:hypothetical protein E2C01_071350 [Portunus trituberculatus]|uniref:Uncharacterized protein n=1 Tax=Portunus trituberculatus TaxID=210409 RepID=A0A5B7I802_PORTR|nr:hypothetical protein [Portunus trituberculatus]